MTDLTKSLTKVTMWDENVCLWKVAFSKNSTKCKRTQMYERKYILLFLFMDNDIPPTAYRKESPCHCYVCFTYCFNTVEIASE